MSFSELKSKRQSKSSTSYVSALSGPVASVHIQSSPQASTVRDDVVVDTEGLYPQLPPSLEIRKADHSGRGLWTRQPFKPGTTILRCFHGWIYCFLFAGSIIMAIQPHVFVLSNRYLDSHCSSCVNSASTSSLMRCSGCGTLRYCNSVSH